MGEPTAIEAMQTAPSHTLPRSVTGQCSKLIETSFFEPIMQIARRCPVAPCDLFLRYTIGQEFEDFLYIRIEFALPRSPPGPWGPTSVPSRLFAVRSGFTLFVILARLRRFQSRRYAQIKMIKQGLRKRWANVVLVQGI